jgi:hypothetical protein
MSSTVRAKKFFMLAVRHAAGAAFASDYQIICMGNPLLPSNPCF